MNFWRKLGIMAALALPLSALSASAHHGVPNFDLSRTVTIKGTVVDYQLVNPHMELYVRVTDDRGNTVDWNIEGVSLLMQMRAGWKRDSFKPGDVVTVTGHPNKEGKPIMVLMKLVTSDGREMASPFDGVRDARDR